MASSQLKSREKGQVSTTVLVVLLQDSNECCYQLDPNVDPLVSPSYPPPSPLSAVAEHETEPGTWTLLAAAAGTWKGCSPASV